jgi:hypothetical protein
MFEENLKKILVLTNYTEDEANTKLTEFNNDLMLVLKDYMGIKDKKEEKMKSVNQEKYKQIRLKFKDVKTVEPQKFSSL